MKDRTVGSTLDWVTVLLYILLVGIGWLNIYSSSLPVNETSLFDISQTYGKQLMFIGLTLPILLVVLKVNPRLYERFSAVFYVIGVLSIIGLFVFGSTIKGQTNWYRIGGFTLQPAEFVKVSTTLFLAKLLSVTTFDIHKFKHQVAILGLLFLPTLLIAKNDVGSALIFVSLIFMLYREGLPDGYLWIGVLVIGLFVAALFIKPIYIVVVIILFVLIHYVFNRSINRNPIVYTLITVLVIGYVYSISFVYENVLETHHKDRINVLIGKNVDLKNEGYNLNQSMITIGSGGVFGKGYLEGTQTKGGFVPEQHTDYIFTTVGEEWGFVGSFVVVFLFVILLMRIVYLAENQKSKFSRAFGYGVASILFTHFAVNILMLIKLFPTIGVPLPFLSYGGSSLWAFSILLFIFLKLDANKVNEW